MANTHTLTLRAARLAACLSAVGLLLFTNSATAQCSGDCDGDSSVSISELIRGVNIALGQQSVDACPAFDGNTDGSVTINELIRAVNAALSGCPPVTPATITPTMTQGLPTETPTPGGPTATATNTPTQRPIPPNCGDGNVDLDEGETCDDGNLAEGPQDFCPANCSVLACTQISPRQTFSVDIDFAADTPELRVQALTVFLRYPDGLAGIPGANNDPAVVASITPGIFDGVTPNDQEYGITLVLQDQSFIGANGGTAATVEFDVCAGASQPDLESFTCTVEGATDVNFIDVPEQVNCELILH